MGLPANAPSETTVYPSYHFGKPSPGGYFDSVFEDPAGPLCVAVFNNSSVRFSATSSEGQIPKPAEDGTTFIAILFSASCSGKITTGTDTIPYSWRLDGNYVKATPGSVSTTATVVLLPKVASAATLKKRSNYNEGTAPRCVNSPPNHFAAVKPPEASPRPLRVNMCGAANGVGLVPDYEFGSCCTTHGICFSKFFAVRETGERWYSDPES